MGSHCGGLLSADQRCNEVVECRAGANLVISMRGRSTDLPIREQLPGHTFSQHEKFHGFSKGHFSIIESDLFLARSEEHTSELQSLTNLVCRLLLEKKNKK